MNWRDFEYQTISPCICNSLYRHLFLINHYCLFVCLFEVLRIQYIMPHDLKFFEIIIDMWSFQLMCWSTITQRNLALFARWTTSLRKITSFLGVHVLRDYIIIWVLSTLRVNLLESNLNATFSNSVLGISIALLIESF